MLPTVIEADGVESCGQAEIDRIHVPTRIRISDRRSADRDRKPCEERFDIGVVRMPKPVGCEVETAPGHGFLLKIVPVESPAFAGVVV